MLLQALEIPQVVNWKSCRNKIRCPTKWGKVIWGAWQFGATGDLHPKA